MFSVTKCLYQAEINFIYYWNVESCHNMLAHKNDKACIYYYIFIENLWNF